MTPLILINKAIKAVPAVRYALGVAGIAAAVAIVLGLKLNPQFAVFGSLTVIALMFVLLVFARAASPENNSDLRRPAQTLIWFYTVVVMAVTILFISSYFAHWPITFEEPTKNESFAPQGKHPNAADTKPSPSKDISPEARRHPSNSAPTISSTSGAGVRRANTPRPHIPASPVKIEGNVTQISQGDCSPNIIGSGNVTNCSPAVKLTASQQTQSKTGNPETPWVTTFTIRSNELIQTGDLTLKCDGPVLRAAISRINPASFSSGSNGPDPNDSNVVIYQLAPEMLDPEMAVSLAVFSRTPVHVVSGSLGTHSIAFQSVKSKK